MKDIIQDKTMRALIHLLGCALNATGVDETVLTDVDRNGLLKLAKSRSVAAMACAAFEKTEIFQSMPPQERKQWTDARDRSVRKSILFDTERGYLLDEFEKQGIRYMPLKGIITKKLYPAPGMREMADNDIWFDPPRRRDVRQIFRDRGYSVTAYNRGMQHDIYQKEPFYNFEMHVSLFGENENTQLRELEKRMIRDSENTHGFHLSKEDFYVYSVAHAYRHYSCYGTGIRSLVDLYVLCRHFENKTVYVPTDADAGSDGGGHPDTGWNQANDEQQPDNCWDRAYVEQQPDNCWDRANAEQQPDNCWDRAYVEHQLEICGLKTFEAESRAIAYNLFSPGPFSVLSSDEQKRLDSYLRSTTYGDPTIFVSNALQEIMQQKSCSPGAAKRYYLLRRIFPGRGYIAPFIERHIYLLPFYWIWRFVCYLPQRLVETVMELRFLTDHHNK